MYVVKVIALSITLIVVLNCFCAFVAYDVTFFRHVGEWKPDERMMYGMMNVFCVFVSLLVLS